MYHIAFSVDRQTVTIAISSYRLARNFVDTLMMSPSNIYDITWHMADKADHIVARYDYMGNEWTRTI